MILVFLIGLIGLSTYKLNEKQQISNQENQDDFGVHFVASEIALPDFSLPNLFEGEENFSKKDFAQKKYSLVNFFASWCTTCRAEHEVLLQIQKLGIVDMYGVSWHDIESNTKSYLAQHQNPFKKIAKDSKGVLGNAANVRAIPETWLVDSDGKVRWIFRGNLQEFSVAEIQSIVLK